MHRTLRSPMFRIGGSAGNGITSGLRQGYAYGDNVDTLKQRMDLVNQLAPRSTEGVNDFLMEWGLNMMGNAPSGNIFQTAAKQAQAPFKTFQAGDISSLGSAGASQFGWEQAQLDADREAARLAAYEPYERLGYQGQGIASIASGMPGQYQSSVTPNPTPLQTAMGIGATGAGIIRALGYGQLGGTGSGGNIPQFRQ